MARLPVAPTKSNLLAVKEQLSIARDGYELLEQKREILVMELMQMVERVKLLEADIEKQVGKAYPSLKRMFMSVGRDRTERVSRSVSYDFALQEKRVILAGMTRITSYNVCYTKLLRDQEGKGQEDPLPNQGSPSG